MRQTQRHYSLDEYFDVEEMSEVRHEYFDGEIFAMSGGTLDHNQIAQNVASALRNERCRPYLADVRVSTPAGLYTYPDVLVICGAPAYTSDRYPTLTNPVVIAEVLSSSTRDYDSGQKFELYSEIPALRDYLLIDQYKIDVEHRFREGAQWQSKRYAGRDDLIALVGVEARLRLAAVYDLVGVS